MHRDAKKAKTGLPPFDPVADDQAGQGNSVETDSFQVVVSNVVPDLWLSGDATVEQDQPYTLTLGNVSDPGDDTAGRPALADEAAPAPEAEDDDDDGSTSGTDVTRGTGSACSLTMSASST